MTCQYLVSAPSGLSIKARALLDSGSSTSFVSEQLSKSLHLRHSPQFNKITGITGLSHSNTSHFVMSFQCHHWTVQIGSSTSQLSCSSGHLSSSCPYCISKPELGSPNWLAAGRSKFWNTWNNRCTPWSGHLRCCTSEWPSALSTWSSYCSRNRVWLGVSW